MQYRIVEAAAGPGYRLSLRFEGGTEASVDLTEFFASGTVTEPVRRDPRLFTDGLRIEGGGAWLGWPGEVEIDADSLWYQAHPADLAADTGGAAA